VLLINSLLAVRYVGEGGHFLRAELARDARKAEGLGEAIVHFQQVFLVNSCDSGGSGAGAPHCRREPDATAGFRLGDRRLKPLASYQIKPTTIWVEP
jgi:hypothetical protein